VEVMAISVMMATLPFWFSWHDMVQVVGIQIELELFLMGQEHVQNAEGRQSPTPSQNQSQSLHYETSCDELNCSLVGGVKMVKRQQG
jgi:hypothetical protein